MNSHTYARGAELSYANYIQAQERIAAIEEAALDAAQGDARAASRVLLNPREETAQSYLYASLCDDRDTYMKRAQLDATMAIMLQQAGR